VEETAVTVAAKVVIGVIAGAEDATETGATAEAATGIAATGIGVIGAEATATAIVIAIVTGVARAAVANDAVSLGPSRRPSKKTAESI
jgi:hypothetical protein